MKLGRNLWMMFKITSTMQTNSFLCLLRKLPVLERLLPVSLYRKRGWKYLFLLGGWCKELFGSFLGNTFLCLLALKWIPAWLGAEASSQERLLLFFLVQCLAPALQSCGIFRAGKKDYVFLNHFMMNPAEYYHCKIGAEVLEKLLTLIPVLFWLLNCPYLVLLALTCSLCFTLAGGCLHLFLYEHFPDRIKRGLRNMVSGGIMLAAYLLFFHGKLAVVWVTESVGVLLSAVLLAVSAACYLRLLWYKDYKHIAVRFANKEAMVLVSVSNGMEEGKDELRGFSWEKNRAFYEKNKNEEAVTYLNLAFFERFQNVFKNQRKQIIVLSTFLGVLCGFLIRNGALSITGETIFQYTPFLLVLVNSIMLFGQRFTMLCFRFLDMPLMYHQRCDKKYIKKSIRCRYLFLVKHSLVALAGLFLFVFFLLRISGLIVEGTQLLALFAAMELLIWIRELYQLLIYYWLQPYTVDATVKSPVFQVLGRIEGLFDISLLFLRGNLARICIPLLGLFLLINVLLVAVQEQAQKNFRLRY